MKRIKVAGQHRASLAPRDLRDGRPLLDRILDTPHLAQVVPRLQPEVLHRIVQSCGLEDCGELVALATPGQLARVFDLDLWGGPPGTDEQLDADRFGLWLEVLVEADAAAAAQTLAGMDAELVIAALAQHARVFDIAAISPADPMNDDDEAAAPIDDPMAGQAHMNDGGGCDIGGYHLVATRTDSWDAIVSVLLALDAEHQHYFHRVMRGLVTLSNSGFELDGLDDLLANRKQVLFDLATDREQRRDQQGYVTPAQARAFLQMSRERRPVQDAPTGNPIASAYFRNIESTAAAADNGSADRLLAASVTPPAPEDSAAAVTALVDVLVDAGVLPRQPLALLPEAHGHAPRLAFIQTQMQFAGDHDHHAFSLRTQELAYLANTIMAGCSIQARAFTPQEASDAAVAVCNLGLQNWTVVEAATRPPLPDDFLVGHKLVGVFQVGWKVLHDRVCMYAAEQLIRVLTRLRCEDRETQKGLNALRVEMKRQWLAGTPWHAREALDVIAILDMPAWAALLGLIDECPVLHAGLGASRSSGTRAVSASAFEFISQNSQIVSVREFMQSLPETLRP